MAKSFYVEMIDGQEVKTEKGKGRTRLGFIKDEQGNYRRDVTFDMSAHRAAKRPVRPQHFYITMDESGNELSRIPVGKGRPNKLFTKDSNGNLVKVVKSAADAATV
jgi:hypothetical protein